MTRRLTFASISCALLAACGGGKSSKTSESSTLYTIRVPASQMTAPKSQQEALAALLRLTNASRREKGRPELVIDPRLARAAQKHAEAMNRAQQLTHQTQGEAGFQQRLMNEGYPQVWCAENIAQAPNAPLVHRLWMESPGHRKNMMGKKYTRVGFGRSGQFWAGNYAQAAGPVATESSPLPPPATSYTAGF
ncbi:CAP domain-containing protein [Verrucomicrobiaceae bacterium 5K15]|uniref:CAP domain-containing protein n=1 Tax=Oceaniferula flava TaxID=2800421 RepID=A0AAE2SE79_9BACT|nr:CAP domain-containing protein [Oceaniferula flavus]MBK1855362.1 CAP domain-containing protein [Oceaniferula flavus]MBM1136668.1 CAP domain-containing protein [Oceaniferula flavus]